MSNIYLYIYGSGAYLIDPRIVAVAVAVAVAVIN
jgi:hypothetical protein